MKKRHVMKRALALAMAMLLALPTFAPAEGIEPAGESAEAIVIEAPEVEAIVPEADLDAPAVEESVPEAGDFALGDEAPDEGMEDEEIVEAQEPAWVYFWVEPQKRQRDGPSRPHRRSAEPRAHRA